LEFIHLIILGLIQGLTEFLPISSSAHLILLPRLAGWQDQGLAYDVAAHFGSLIAVVIYFRHDIGRILFAGMQSVTDRSVSTTDSRFFWNLVVASVPVLLSGFLLHDFIVIYLRDPLIIAGTSVLFGLLLWVADVKGRRQRDINSMSVRDAIMIGLAQAIALIPGTSRSGITITVGLMLGLDRASAARFSFLMAIPVILAATIYEDYKMLILLPDIDIVSFIIVVLVSAVSALLAIHYFFRFLEKAGMLPYVIYRILLGIVLIYLFI
jgi:undecaprenyl-diphosphatase